MATRLPLSSSLECRTSAMVFYMVPCLKEEYNARLRTLKKQTELKRVEKMSAH
jgi:hypothetical protein